MIFIAYNHNENCIGIVNAKSRELAVAFWQGKGEIPHVIKSLDDDYIPLEEHNTGVYELLKIKVNSGYELHRHLDNSSDNSKKYYLV